MAQTTIASQATRLDIMTTEIQTLRTGTTIVQAVKPPPPPTRKHGQSYAATAAPPSTKTATTTKKRKPTPLVSGHFPRNEWELIIRTPPPTTSIDDTVLLDSVLVAVNKATTDHGVHFSLAHRSNKSNLVLVTILSIKAAATTKVQFLLASTLTSLGISSGAVKANTN